MRQVRVKAKSRSEQMQRENLLIRFFSFDQINIYIVVNLKFPSKDILKRLSERKLWGMHFHVIN